MLKELAGSQMFQRSGYARGIFRLYRFLLCGTVQYWIESGMNESTEQMA